MLRLDDESVIRSGTLFQSPGVATKKAFSPYVLRFALGSSSNLLFEDLSVRRKSLYRHDSNSNSNQSLMSLRGAWLPILFGTSIYSSLSVKTRVSKPFLDVIERHHIFLNYFKALSIGPAGARTLDLMQHSPALYPLSYPLS